VDLVDGCRAAVDAGGAVPVRRRWVRPGPCDSPARKSGSARRPTAQNTTPQEAVIGHMLASASAMSTARIARGGHAPRVFDRSGISSRMGGRLP
jgi:hypothetical protein